MQMDWTLACPVLQPQHSPPARDALAHAVIDDRYGCLQAGACRDRNARHGKLECRAALKFLSENCDMWKRAVAAHLLAHPITEVLGSSSAG